MSALPASGYPSNASRTEGEMKQYFEDIRSNVEEHLGGAAESELTISGGSITPTIGAHSVDTESDAAADDLANIITTNHPDGRLLLIRAEHTDRTVVVKHLAGGAGQITLREGADYSLTDTNNWLILIRVGTDWEEVTRSHLFWQKGADIASASALILGTDGNYFDVTGTTAVTSITSNGSGAIKLHFDGVLTLTHHATDLIIPGGANITTAAGDEAEFIEYATGDFRCTSYTKASGEAVIGAPTQQIAKVWGHFDGTGTPAIDDSYNIDSITDVTTGQWTVNFTNDMANTNYSVVLSGSLEANQAAGNAYLLSYYTKAVGSVKVFARYVGSSGASATFIDLDNISIQIFGDQ